jgi:hypothetical protein
MTTQAAPCPNGTTGNGIKYTPNYLPCGIGYNQQTSATWTASLPRGGSWQVSIHEPAFTSYGWGVPYAISTAQGSQAVSVQQQANAGKAVTFGPYSMNAGANTVQMTNQDGWFHCPPGGQAFRQFLAADWVQWVWVGP